MLKIGDKVTVNGIETEITGRFTTLNYGVTQSANYWFVKDKIQPVHKSKIKVI